MAFEDKTPELLHTAMLGNIDSSLDKREGSLIHIATGVGAIEMAHSYTELDSVLGLGFAETTEGIYLDLRAGEFGLTRKASTKAQGFVTLTGPINTLVATGTRVQTTQGISFVTLADVILTNGSATVEAEAEAGGALGNVAASTITALAAGPLYGIVTVTNPQSFEGGTNTETDAELLKRLKDRVQKPPTSGNVNHYRQWALEVSGIGDVLVIPIANGPGTVKVVLLDTENSAPSQAIIDVAIEHIEANRPVNVNVEVVGVEEVPINISATLTLESGVSLDDAKNEVSQVISDYLRSLAFVDQTVRYTRIASLMFDAPSIVDYTSLKVNGGTSNIVLSDGSVAALGTVTVS